MLEKPLPKGKLTRLSFYLCLYLVPAIIALCQPHQWLTTVISLGGLPGLWRACRRGRVEPTRALPYAFTTATLSVLVGGVTALLGASSLPFWGLVAFEQAHRRECRRRMAYSAAS